MGWLLKIKCLQKHMNGLFTKFIGIFYYCVWKYAEKHFTNRKSNIPEQNPMD